MTELSEVLAERKTQHGDFTEHARIVQNLKAMVQNEPRYGQLGAIQRESIEMILHKIGRIIAGNPDFPDHWLDISGYAKLVHDRVVHQHGEKKP